MVRINLHRSITAFIDLNSLKVDTHCLLGQLFRKCPAVRLPGLCTFLSLGCFFDPADELRMAASVLLQGGTQSFQISASAIKPKLKII